MAVVDTRGREVDRCTVEHAAAGWRALLAMLGRNGVSEVVIERPDGPFDAFVLADTLRTDRARLRPLTPGSPATVVSRRACRARFPTPESLACLAGAAPSTRQSGKISSVGFRWACDKQLRDAVTDIAGDTRGANPWAADLYNRARARDRGHPHAVRIPARAWLFVIWHCWQDSVAYNPARHHALQRLLNQDQPEAA
ncbi:transposase [Actinophytocola xinjiangensis]|uniref:transposase n=1 Tax=Actinophytocola xinjiangensis TaxID=485602 RepID=UPI000A079EA4|nr:transposase [Actinophytocola xinjiangensis]